MRTSKAAWGALAAIIILGTTAGPASAGGNWIEWRRRHNVAGKVVVARNIFFARSEARVRRAGPYYAYIAPETFGWQLPNVNRPGTIRLGRVKVIWPGPNSHFKGFLRFNPRATIRFTVPDVPSGNYLIAFCDLGCTRTLGDVDPTGSFSIVHSAKEGRLTRRLDKLSLRFREYRYHAERARDRVESELAGDLGDLGRDLNYARLRIEALDERLTRIRRDQRAEDSFPWAPIAGAGFIFGLAAFLLGLRGRRRFHRESMDAELRRIIDDTERGDIAVKPRLSHRREKAAT